MQELDKFKNEMNLSGKNVYVGHRYVPKIFGEWDSKQIYDSLSIVQYKGASYTSRQYVPTGVEITNEDYWVLTGNYNAQVEYYRQDVSDLHDTVNEFIPKTTTDLNVLKIKGEFVKSVKEFGAKGDGITDDTDAINAAIESVFNAGGGKVLIPKGTYMIKSHDETNTGDKIVDMNFNYNAGIHLKDNVTIIGAGRETTILKAITNSSESYNVIRIKNVKNAGVYDLTVEGDKGQHLGNTGEWGFGVYLIQSQNIILDINAKNCWGDGIYVGIGFNNKEDTIQTTNIYINHPIIDNCRRNGLSICSGENIYVQNPKISNTGGTFPMAAIDFEIEGTGYIKPTLKGVNVNSPVFKKNRYGIVIAPSDMIANNGEMTINVANLYSSEEQVTAVFATSNRNVKEIEGKITFTNTLIEETGWASVDIRNYLAKHPKIEFKGIKIVNANNTNHNIDHNLIGWQGGSAFIISRDANLTNATDPIGNVVVKNLESIDNRLTKYTNTAFTCFDGTNLKPEKVYYIDPIQHDELRDGRKAGVVVKDSNEILTFNDGYYIITLDGLYPKTVIKSSETPTDRVVNIFDSVTNGNETLLVNNKEGKFAIDLGATTKATLIGLPTTQRYIKTSDLGATMKIKKTADCFIPISITGTWVNSATV